MCILNYNDLPPLHHHTGECAGASGNGVSKHSSVAVCGRCWPLFRLHEGFERISTDGYILYGINGVFGGAATLFFAYTGFDSDASTAEEVKNPQRDLPPGIGLALFISGGLYILVSGVIVGLVPYSMMDPDTPMSTAFAENGMPWAMYVVAAGAVAALAKTLMDSPLPQPRILMAMAPDGLLPPFFSAVHPKTAVPVNGTVLAGTVAALMAFMMDVDQLSGLFSHGYSGSAKKALTSWLLPSRIGDISTLRKNL